MSDKETMAESLKMFRELFEEMEYDGKEGVIYFTKELVDRMTTTADRLREATSSE